MWSNVSVVSVNTNGIKKNGHLFVESMLSKHSATCVQETKFSDATHLSKFKFHLDSSFQHRVFVNDPNCQLARPTRGRSNGVLTVLRSDFPGFDTAEEIPQLAVPGRYLVVKVMVEGAPIYVHNVYAPVDQQEKQQFFSSLETESFEDRATHYVLGDLNTPLAQDSTRRLPTCATTLVGLAVWSGWRDSEWLTRGGSTKTLSESSPDPFLGRTGSTTSCCRRTSTNATTTTPGTSCHSTLETTSPTP